MDEPQNHANLDDVKLSIFKTIDLFYNPKRIYQALGYLSLQQQETEYALVIKVA